MWKQNEKITANQTNLRFFTHYSKLWTCKSRVRVFVFFGNLRPHSWRSRRELLGISCNPGYPRDTRTSSHLLALQLAHRALASLSARHQLCSPPAVPGTISARTQLWRRETFLFQVPGRSGLRFEPGISGALAGTGCCGTCDPRARTGQRECASKGTFEPLMGHSGSWARQWRRWRGLLEMSTWRLQTDCHVSLSQDHTSLLQGNYHS